MAGDKTPDRGGTFVLQPIQEDWRRLNKVLGILAEKDLPFLKPAMEEAGGILRAAVQKRAKGKIARSVRMGRVYQGKRGDLRASVTVYHKGGRSMEFGRQWYYRGFRRSQRVTHSRVRLGTGIHATVGAKGQRFRANPGQVARPFFGIVSGGEALGEVGGQIETILGNAIEREFERIEGGA